MFSRNDIHDDSFYFFIHMSPLICIALAVMTQLLVQNELVFDRTAGAAKHYFVSSLAHSPFWSHVAGVHFNVVIIFYHTDYFRPSYVYFALRYPPPRDYSATS